MRRTTAAIFLVVLPLLAASCITGPFAKTLEPSVNVHAFYYPWYGNPDTDGFWFHWAHGESDNKVEPEQIAANYYPSIGLYSSNSEAELEMHMRQLRQAGVGVIATSWWGPDHFTDKLLPLLLDVAHRHGIKVNFHLEPIAGRNDAKAAVYRDAIVYVIDHYGDHPAIYRDPKRGNKPLYYIYDSYLVQNEDWGTIFARDGSRTLRGTPYDGVFIGLYVKDGDDTKMLESHFDGFYTYFATEEFTYGSTVANWPALAKFARDHDLLYIPSVGPGYDDTVIRAWNTANQRGREGGAYYDRMWRAALDQRPEIVSITSFNEWHEGTQIEPAQSKTTPAFTFLDYAPRAPEYYLERTAHWVRELERRARSW